MFSLPPGTMRRIAEEQEKQKEGQVAKFNASKPQIAKWDDMRDPSGLLKAPYQLADPTKDSRVGLGLLQAEATREGPSAWRTLEEAQQADQLARQSAGQLAQGQSQLAMRGGLRSGAGERMASNMAAQNLLGRQNISRMGAMGDEQRRMQAMQNLPAAELQEATFQRGTQQYNIDNALREQYQKRIKEAKDYEEQMRAWGAERTAAATPSSGGGSMCFITTAVCDTLGLPDDNAILNDFRKFRDEHMGGKKGLAKYYEIAPKIVAAIDGVDSDEIYYDILITWLLPALKCIRAGEIKEAENIYTLMVISLENDYLKKGEEV